MARREITLTELLVILGVISLLVTILVPQFNRIHGFDRGRRPLEHEPTPAEGSTP